MNFLFPIILWGLFAVSIPVIIHLFNFRRFKKVYFTNVAFLQELKQQTRKRAELRQLIIMALRMLAIASIVFAFAQPFIPIGDDVIKKNAQNLVSIYVDNSFSMEANSTEGSLFDEAVKKAGQVIASFKNSDRFHIITNDFEGYHQRLVNKDEFTDLLDNVQISPAVKTLQEVRARQIDMLMDEQDVNKYCFYISDLQKNIVDLQPGNEDTNIVSYFIPVQAIQTDNLFIDSCWFESPIHQLNQNVKLIVRLTNASGIEYEKIPIRLFINNNQKALASFDIGALQSAEISLPFTNYEAGIQFGELSINDFPIVFDDYFYLAYDVYESISLLIINGDGENTYLNSLFGPDPAFEVKNMSAGNIDYATLRNYSLIILNNLELISSGLAQELTRFAAEGGTLVIIPSGNADVETYRSLLRGTGFGNFGELRSQNMKVSLLDTEHQVFNDVFEKMPGQEGLIPEHTDLPVVLSYYPLGHTNTKGYIDLIKLQNDDPFLRLVDHGKGSIYFLAVPLDPEYSNLPNHALFVPTFYKIGLLSAATDPLYYSIGEDESIKVVESPARAEQVFKITALDGTYEFIPEALGRNRQIVLQFDQGLEDAGHYTLNLDREIIKGLAFNYNRKESSMDFYNEAALKDLLEDIELSSFKILQNNEKPISQNIAEMYQGIRLWKLFIIFALVFLALEIVLLRLWKP